jgi:hypothetical protein
MAIQLEESLETSFIRPELKHAKEILESIPERLLRHPLLRKRALSIAKQMYFTTFTDDSGFLPKHDQLGLLALREYSDQKAALELLGYINRLGNWIVKECVKEYLENTGQRLS